jgi:hypothetical protein
MMDTHASDPCQVVPGLTSKRRAPFGDLDSAFLIDEGDLAAAVAPRKFWSLFGDNDPLTTKRPRCHDKAVNDASDAMGMLGLGDWYHNIQVPEMPHEMDNSVAYKFVFGQHMPVRRDLHTKSDDMASCPPGYAVIGIDDGHPVLQLGMAGNGELLCIEAIDPAKEMCVVDAGMTQRHAMHACPLGMWARGIDAPGNRFTCCRSRSGAPNVGVEHVVKNDDSLVREGTHACPPGEVVLGGHGGRNELLCASLPPCVLSCTGNERGGDGCGGRC